MAGYEDEFDMAHGQFYDEDHGGSENDVERMFSALTVMTAFAFIAQAPLFTRAALVEGTVVADGAVIVGETKYWSLTVEQAEECELAMMMKEQLGAAYTIPQATADLITDSALAGMAHGEGLFTGAAIAFLFDYSNDPEGTGANWSSWHDYVQVSGGGHNFCITWGDPPEQACWWEYD